MTRYSNGPRVGRKPAPPAGLWGSSEFLFGVTRGAYGTGKPRDRFPSEGTVKSARNEAAKAPAFSALLHRISGWAARLLSRRQDHAGEEEVPASPVPSATVLSLDSARPKAAVPLQSRARRERRVANARR